MSTISHSTNVSLILILISFLNKGVFSNYDRKTVHVCGKLQTSLRCSTFIVLFYYYYYEQLYGYEEKTLARDKPAFHHKFSLSTVTLVIIIIVIVCANSTPVYRENTIINCETVLSFCLSPVFPFPDFSDFPLTLCWRDLIILYMRKITGASKNKTK